ncbi:Hsp20/alpha crystallin family protein [Pacificimonas sp. WHA3]|uniref:Hsp20/alpha crystallin family protein n=1 Tax=Pacificimonas pallii TaxID=2827236 RepID=A0ABS6SET4_9SPHN|nr:Hsp20/alpha crystallin family protein [Pacificimonas pallii]MBV7256608.1 Hsp20/alpha crystallin family protein [Pacificimonas pallii]
MTETSLIPALRAGRLPAIHPFRSLQHQIDRMFDEFGAASDGGENLALRPRIDISEDDGAYRMTAELPGVPKGDVDLRVEEDQIVLRAEKKNSREEKDRNYHLMERSFGIFQRSIGLAHPVDPEKVEASFEDGVLNVTLPKRAETKPNTRRIPLK